MALQLYVEGAAGDPQQRGRRLHLEAHLLHHPEDVPTLQEVERRHILRVMEEVSFQVETAASLLGIPRSTLYVKLKGYGIQTSRFQNPSPESGI